jgi:hypothetical protein
MTPSQLETLLPSFKGDEDIISQHQTEKGIVREVLAAHKRYAWQYDLIAGLYTTYDEYSLCKELYDFCRKYLPYIAESKEYQSTRSLAGIMATRKTLKSDCKHYSGFIGGVLDAVGRINGYGIDWNYRFAGYENDNDMNHVYIVCVLSTGQEIWLDPAPIFNSFTQSYTQREFNDRMAIPSVWEDKYIKPMLVTLSGPRMGDLNVAPPSGGPSNSTLSPGAQTAAGNAQDQAALQQKEAELNAALPGAGSAVQQVLDVLPDGAIKDFLTSFLANPDKALMTLIFGRKFTIGDYKVGEIYMRNILGMTQVIDNEQVPDSYVPQAWSFWSAVMGVRIRTFDDMDTLTGASASPPSVRGAAYLQRNPAEVPDISMAAAIRAATILGDTSVSRFNMWDHHADKWPLSIFVSIPYVYPLPGPVENQNFSGVHPVLGTAFVNGYPTDYTGVRTMSQTNQTLQQGVTVAPQPTGTPTNPGPPGANAAGFSGIGAALLALLAAGLIFGGKGKRKSVTGPKGGKGALLMLGLGVGGFILYKHFNSPDEKRAKLMAYANSLTDVSRKMVWLAKLPLLSDAQVTDLYNYLYSYEIPLSQGQPVGISSALLTANITLYTQYGIPDFPDSMNLALNAGGGALPAALPVSQTSSGGGNLITPPANPVHSNNPDAPPADAFVPSPYMPPLGTSVQVVQPSIYDMYADNQPSGGSGITKEEFSTAV